MYNLTGAQIEAWQTAYKMGKEDKYQCFGSLAKTKEGKLFFAPFLQAGYIHAPTLKYTGVMRLTDKGRTKFEELLNRIEV
jgi:hypothetical protein